MSAASTKLPEVRFTASLIHYTRSEAPPFDAWAIIAGKFAIPSREKPVAPPANLEATLDAIFAVDKNPRINSITLGNGLETLDLHSEVSSIMLRDREVRLRNLRSEPVEKSEELRQAILKSNFLASIQRALEKRGKPIRDVSVGHVIFLLNEDPPDWLGWVYLWVDE